MFTATRLAATNGEDFIGDSIVVEFNASNAGEQHCLTIPVLDDTVYEGEELFAFEIDKDDTLDVSIPNQDSIVRITDNDGMCLAFLCSLLYGYFFGCKHAICNTWWSTKHRVINWATSIYI